jgi:PAS domain S-box-containing protein
MNHSHEQMKTQVATLFPGESEMARRMRDFDWSQTPLGPVDRWPQSLRSSVSMLLPSKAQIVLFWGPELVALYNDAYREIFGTKHPWALGQPARECWSEIWNVLDPLLAGVVITGEAFWAKDHPFFLERQGYTEETYFDVSYDPVRDETGDVGGVFCIVRETTELVLSERRLRTLRDLAARGAEARAEEEACRIAAETLAANPHDIPFALLYLLDGANAQLAGVSGIAANTAASPREVALTPGGDAPDGWPFADVLADGHSRVVDDLSQRFGRTGTMLPGGPWPESPTQAVLLPLTRAGQEQPASSLAGFLIVGVSPRRALDDNYQGFCALIAGQVATAVGNARAYEEERKRAEALAEIDRAKTTFFSNVSHEFRTPLTLMLGPLEDLLAKNGVMPQEEREHLEVAHRNSLRLLKLVNTLLDFSRIEAGRIDAAYEPTDLAALTAGLSSVFRSAIERAGLRLVVNCPPLNEPVYVDREMWEKIVLNLLSNAFKFTFAGEIEVGLRIEEERESGEAGERESGEAGEREKEISAIRNPQSVILTVRDTGTGIPAEAMPHLFERFHRVKGARARTHEGTGIGLALVQELVNLHGGTVSVASEVNRGTTFTVSIPTGKDHLPADRIGVAHTLASTGLEGEVYVDEALRWLPSEERGSGRAGERESGGAGERESGRAGERESDDSFSRSRILLADDNADMRDYVRRVLGEKYEVEAVADGEAALLAVHGRVPDLVLSDVMMPRLDGFELIRELRADKRTATVPVILLSARAGEESKLEGLASGADDYLIKPFSARELLARVSAHLEMARVRREAEEALRESEERFRAIVSQTTAGVAECDLAGRFIFANRRFCEIVGYSETELHAMRMHDITHTDDLPGNAEQFRRLVEGGPNFVVEKRYLRKDGGEVWVNNSVNAVRDASGRVRSIVAVTLDVTERRQVEADARLLVDLVELIRLAEDADDLLSEVSSLIGERLRVQRCFFIEIDTANDLGVVRRDYCRGVKSVAGQYRISDYSPVTRAEIEAGQNVVNRDSQTDPRTAAWFETTYRKRGERAYIAVPLRRAGLWAATLWVSTDQPRDWTPREVALLETVAERVWLAVEKLRLDAELRRANSRFERAESASNGFIYEWDLRTNAFDLSAGFPKVLGYGQDEITQNRHWWGSLIHPEDLEGLRNEIAAEMERAGGYSVEYRVRHKDGHYVDVWDRGLAMRDRHGRPARVIGSAVDITKRKQMEDALKEADRRKDEFLAMLAHELRNPLASIRNAAQVMKLIGTPQPDHQWAREVIERQVHHMTLLLNDLLDVSRITQGKVRLQREPLELATIVNRAVETIRPLIDARHHHLVITLPDEIVRVEGDLTRLVQVVGNLLNNAAKFTDEGGHIWLEAAREVDQVIIRVRDDGMGLPTDLLPHVFDLFTQADRSLDRSQGGLGIGLTIVRNIVEMHGGSVEARSDGLGQGSEFIIRLPALQSAEDGTRKAEAADGSAHPTPGATHLKVLVVEDNVDSAEMMSFIMKLIGHEVRVAHDGPSALEAARAFQPHVVLCDIGLPGMNGYEVGAQLREQSDFNQTRLIALSGYGQEEDRRLSIEAGFDYHLTKPVEPDELEALLDSLRSAGRVE